MLALALLALACAPESAQSVTLAPDGPRASEIEDVLRAADARWEAAGVAPNRIVIAPGGAPVRLVPDRAPVAETRTRGRGGDFMGVRWVELYDLDIDVATHELGHALGIDAVGFVRHSLDASGECEGEQRPAMCAHVGHAITTADLELACAAGPCDGFTPEE